MLKKLALALAIALVAATLYSLIAGHTRAAKDRQKLRQTYIQLQQSKQTLQQQKASNASTQKQIKQLNQQLQETQKQLQAKRDSAKVYAAAISAVPAGSAKAFIYSHESGNNPNSVNSIGCRGLGQACPGSKLPCGNDYACQDAYFTSYMQGRYGTWENAAAFWRAHHWW